LLGYLLLLAFPLLVHADGGAPNLAYVVGTTQGISVIDIAQQKVTSTFPLGGSPQSVYLSLDGRFLYVTQPTLNRVSMLSAKTGQVICSAAVPGKPSLLSYDPQTSSLFVAGNAAASISNIDMSNCSVLHTWSTRDIVSGLAVVNLASDTLNNQLWVAHGTDVSVFDTKTRQQLASIPLPGNPRFISAPSGLEVYVTTQQGSLYAIDLASYRVMALLSGGQFGCMDFDEVTGQVYVPDSLHQQLDVITPPNVGSIIQPREPSQVYHLGASPQSVAITSDGQFGFIALSTGSVMMLDIPARQITRTISVGGSPHFIITGLYPPTFGSTPQQASIVDTLASIAAYLLLVACILVPIWFFARQNKRRRAAKV
jgi:DNA-binding beta-propeller fold protein YncE